MSETINRLYDSADRARQAAEELRGHRLHKFTEVHVTGDGVPADEAAVLAALVKAKVLKAHARQLVPGVLRGGTLVTVHAPFGSAVAARQVLDRHGPIDSGLPDAHDPALWDEAAPMSSFFGVRVLIDHEDSFSRFWSLPILTRQGRATCESLGLPLLSDSSRPYKGLLGLPLLSRNPAPLSSLLGLPLLRAHR